MINLHGALELVIFGRNWIIAWLSGTIKLRFWKLRVLLCEINECSLIKKMEWASIIWFSFVFNIKSKKICSFCESKTPFHLHLKTVSKQNCCAQACQRAFHFHCSPLFSFLSMFKGEKGRASFDDNFHTTWALLKKEKTYERTFEAFFSENLAHQTIYKKHYIFKLFFLVLQVF